MPMDPADRRTRRRTRASVGRIHLALVVGACGGTAPGPSEPGSDAFTVAELVGEYRASTLVVNRGQPDEIDAIARGGELTITLAGDRTTTGRLFVPGGAEDGSDFDVPMTGTWALIDRDKVDFDQPWDTFVRDMVFTASRTPEGIVLGGRETFPGPFTVEVSLRRV